MTDYNQFTVIGRLGADAEVRTTQGGKEVASFSVAADTGYKDKETGKWKENVNWFTVVTFQAGLINIIKDRGKKGARVFVQGELQIRKWRKDGESSDRKEPEIGLNPDSTLIFLDKPDAK